MTEVTPLAARQAEVSQYDSNIAMYESIKNTLPTWEDAPEHLLEHRNATNKHEVAAKIQNIADVELLSKLWYSDECAAAIRAEIVERTKAQAILTILEK